MKIRRAMSNVFFGKAIVAILSMFFISCETHSFQENLNTGLTNYKKARFIDNGFIKGYELNKIAFFKEDNANYTFVFKLDDSTIKDSVEKYRLGIVFFPKGDTMAPMSKWWYMEPTIQTLGEYQYIIEKVTVPSKNIDSLRLFLSDKDGYHGVIGNVLILKNLKL